MRDGDLKREQYMLAKNQILGLVLLLSLSTRQQRTSKML
jgi:hypothetical protein